MTFNFFDHSIHPGCLCIAYVRRKSGEIYWGKGHPYPDGNLLPSTGIVVCTARLPICFSWSLKTLTRKEKRQKEKEKRAGDIFIFWTVCPNILQDDYLDCYGHPEVIGKVVS